MSPYIRNYQDDFKIPSRFIQSDEPVFAYGTIQFIQDITKKHKNIVAFYDSTRFNVDQYLSTLPKQLFVNGDGVFLTYGLIKQDPLYAFRLFMEDELFFRPNSGNKLFTGLTMNRENVSIELNSLDQLSSATEQTLIYISRAKKIKREFRTVLVNNQVLDSCQYMVSGELSISKDVPDEAIFLAQKLANIDNILKPDPYLVCDIAELENGEFKVIELNALSTSDLYKCSPTVLIKAFEYYINEHYL